MNRTLKWTLAVLLAIGMIAISLVGPINRTPLEEQPFYQQMMANLDTLKLIPTTKGKLKIGWNKINITPNHPMPMAGYTLREHFDSVHDSLYARILFIDNGTQACYIITADLLLFPPALREELEAQRKNDFLYFAGTHTHNGIGGWNKSIAGQFILGDFESQWVTSAATTIVQGMESAKAQALRGSISYWEVNAAEYAENRLVGKTGFVDGVLRGMRIIRDDSSKAMVASFSAHPTNISKSSTALSGDYPAALIDQFETHGYQFGQFLTGMVGSHRWKAPPLQDFELVAEEGKLLYEKVLQASFTAVQDSVPMTVAHLPLQLGPSQLRIAKNWKLRDWAFRGLMGRLKGEITYLELGNVILLGTSCDFSGEIYVANQLDALAAERGKKLIITSFNGYYTGYITLDERYDLEKEEVMALNWVGPYYGAYYAKVISRLLD